MTQDIYCLWLMPEKEAAGELQRVITELAMTYEAVYFEPHLTLSIVPVVDLCDPEGALDSLISRSKPLTLHEPKVTIGNLFTQSVYLRFEESNDLNCLQALSCDIFTIKPSVFYPHLSLIYKDLDEKMKQEIASKIRLTRDRITFDRLRLVKSSSSVTSNADVKAWKTVFEKGF